jgi:4-hydroxy 2-oxovalerate aldolase
MKLLDCTIRDGGYYTNWDFNQNLIEEYAITMENLPIDYIEVGYRSIALEGYYGKYFYCPIYVLEELKKLMPSKKLAIILNEKDIRPEHLEDLLSPIKPFISLIRIAVDPKNIERAIILAKSIKKLGFELAFNVMYMSKWKDDASFLDSLKELDKTLNFFYMVDSYGGILPSETKEIIDLVRSKTSIPLGFHGHDNLHMGLINTITALNEGCVIVDSTITGMGRGAGNLKTELLLTYLESKGKVTFDFNQLASLVSMFEELKLSHNWGTSLPYMFSGAHSLPQKDVMEWIGTNRYSLPSILTALKNKKLVVEDNIQLPLFNNSKTYAKAIIVGGGKSLNYNEKAIYRFLELNENIALINVGLKSARTFSNVKNDKFICLVGVENEEDIISITSNQTNIKLIYGPFPRIMGTSITSQATELLSSELNSISFTSGTNDSPFTIAAQLSIDLNVKDVFLVGFDGYNTTINKNQSLLEKENQIIINDLGSKTNLFSLSPTKYDNVEVLSIYSFLK